MRLIPSMPRRQGALWPAAAGAVFACSSVGIILSARAQAASSGITDDQIAAYQVGLEAGCKRVGRKRGDSPEPIDRYCACVIGVLRENATRTQWQQAAFAALRSLPREEALALSEHTLKFRECRSNAP